MVKDSERKELRVGDVKEVKPTFSCKSTVKEKGKMK